MSEQAIPRIDVEQTLSESTGSTAAPAISVVHLTKVYGGGKSAVRAVDDVSFTIEPGSVIGLLGPNGAGKTTAIKTIVGLVVPTAGEVYIGGIDVHTEPRAAYRQVGAMLEGARNVYWRLTVRENLEFFTGLAGHSVGASRERHDEVLEQFDLAEMAETTVNNLSRGMKQKVALACTLSRKTPVVFLDEPTLGLDVESSIELRREIRRLAKRESRTVILSSHDMDVVEAVCDRVIVMNRGRIVADDTTENLIDLFRTHAYQVTIKGTLPSATRRRLECEYDADKFEQSSGRESFLVSLVDGMTFYAMIDTLSEADRPLVSVTSIEPDLEDAFLKLTAENGGA